MKYKQLNYEQRYTIECMLKTKNSKSVIAKALGVDKSSIYRELNRNKKPRGSYNADYAQMLADERKKEGHYKKKLTERMKRIISDKLKLNWSPEQIVGWSKQQDIDMVSHERIYQYIWQEKSEGGTLYKYLRTGEKRYKKRYGKKSSRGQIPNRVSIEKRPEVVNEKSRIGDFEIDLIIGKGHKGAMLTIVDRKSNFTITHPLKRKNADEIESGLINALAPYKQFTHTITSDNGKEFTNHERISKKMKADFFFAHPYASWERGANENTNKLIRQYLPKNSDLRCVDNDYNLHIMNRLNNRPRKKLNYKTPAQVFYGDIRNLKVALGG